jgi:protein SCO1/2
MTRVCAFALAALLGSAPGALAQLNVPPPEAAFSYDQMLNQQIPLDLLFRDEAGHEVRLGDAFGKRPVVLALVQFRCRMLCTQVLNGLLETLRGMPGDAGDQFEVVVVSFDPREKPDLARDKKAAYVEAYGREHTAKGWHFLTGEQEAITALTETVGFRYAYNPQGDVFAHPSGLVVSTPEGKPSKYFYGIKYPVGDLQQAIDAATVRRIGRPVKPLDRVLLLCYDYDPATGTFVANVMKAVRLGGALTVLVIGGALFIAWRRERRLSRSSFDASGNPLATLD